MTYEVAFTYQLVVRMWLYRLLDTWPGRWVLILTPLVLILEALVIDWRAAALFVLFMGGILLALPYLFYRRVTELHGGAFTQHYLITPEHITIKVQDTVTLQFDRYKTGRATVHAHGIYFRYNQQGFYVFFATTRQAVQVQDVLRRQHWL